MIQLWFGDLNGPLVWEDCAGAEAAMKELQEAIERLKMALEQAELLPQDHEVAD